MPAKPAILGAIDKANSKELEGAGKLHLDGIIPFGAAASLAVVSMDNGLRILMMVDRSAPVVAYATWYRVGSRHEKPGKTGLAHLFEHLMFNETEHLKAGQFDRKLE